MLQSDQAKRLKPVPLNDFHGTLNAAMASVAVAASLALNNKAELLAHPADTQLIDLTFIVTDLDSGGSPSITINFGFLAGEFGDDDDTRVVGTDFAENSDIGQAGGVLSIGKDVLAAIAPSATTRGIGFEVSAAAATGAAGTVTAIATYVSV